MTGGFETNESEKTFRFDGSDPELIRELIRKHGDSDTMFSGTNTEGERMTISIDKKNGVVTNTYQNNGWVRVNHYGVDGAPEGETFDGRWK